MRVFRNRPAHVVFALLTMSLCLPNADAQTSKKIEAKEGKQYRLTKQHGPWMIMVANFRDIPKTRLERDDDNKWRPVKNERYREGQSAQEAADKLVYELREKGIPAYTFSQSDVPDELSTVDRFGRQRTARFLAQKGRVCVLAGNYPNTNDKIAQRTLNHVKSKFKSPSLEGKKSVNKRKRTTSGIVDLLTSGGVLMRTPGKPSPLAGAFLTINPLLTPEEAARRNRDPLLLKLNASGKYNLLDNPGQYTLVVATSYIKHSKVTKDKSQFQKALETFQPSSHLDETMANAWQLTRILREGHVPFKHDSLGVTRRNFDAYVFHNRHGSMVTIGAFNSVNDPLIAEYKKIFGAKMRKNPLNQKEVLVAEVMTLPDPKNPKAALQSWIFDPTPRLIEVPNIR